MTATTKTILKSYFQQGDFPTESQFADLIDSFPQIPSSNGIIVQVSAGDTQARSIDGTTNEISVSAANGLLGNPTLSLPSTITLTGKTLTGGTFTGGTFVSAALTSPSLGVATATSISFGQDALNYFDEGSWTPVLTFTTPGNLSVTYSAQYGRYQRIGNYCRIWCTIVTSAFTHTTASGALRITGLPFTSAADDANTGAAIMGGYTKANFTQIAANAIASQTYLQLEAGGSGQARSSIAFGDVPSGGTVSISLDITIKV